MGIKRIILGLLPKGVQVDIEDFFRRQQSKRDYHPSKFEKPLFQSSIAALDYYKCIFVHIPKNAGLSVCYTLFGNTGGSHRKIIGYKKIFSPKTFRRYYKFTFVRNPWDRLVSTYFFLKKGGLTEKDRIWADSHLGSYSDFDSFVKGWLSEENISNSLHFQHQHRFLEDEKGEIHLDFIGRFENIEADFLTISAKLGIDKKLKKSNASDRNEDYQFYYNDLTRTIVSEVYEKDIRLFNYKF
jgi:hypothetical protein